MSTSGLLDAAIISDFGITAVHELRRVVEFELHAQQLRLEILYWHSNPKCPWVAQMLRRDGAFKPWIPWEEFPWVEERDEETAIRTALGFADERTR